MLSLQEGHVAHVYQATVDPSVSTAAMKAAPPSRAGMEDCAQKRPASRSSTASAPVAGQANGVSRAWWSPKHLHALWQIVMAKPTTAFVIRNVTHLLAAGTAATALWQ